MIIGASGGKQMCRLAQNESFANSQCGSNNSGVKHGQESIVF